LARYAGIGSDGLRNMHGKTAAVVGCGGLGSALITLLARYPLGGMRLIDRDIVEESNLAHQILFTAEDAGGGATKCEAAAAYARRINPEINCEAVFADLRVRNADTILSGADIVIDGLDNWRTRFLINDWCMKNRVPYVYGGVVEDEATAKAVVPGKTSCLRCLLPEPPEPGTTRTCDVYGVHLPVISVAAGVMVDIAVRIFAGQAPEGIGDAATIKLVGGAQEMRSISGSRAMRPGCPACGGRYEFFDPANEERAGAVCGANAIATTLDYEIDLAKLAAALPAEFEVSHSKYFVRAKSRGGIVFTAYAHGRIMADGTRDESVLRGFISRYLGG